MKLLDSIQTKGLHKLVLCEDCGFYSVLSQGVNRKPTPLIQRMSREAAKACWRKELVGYFFNVSRNVRDAMKMAEKRCSSI